MFTQSVVGSVVATCPGQGSNRPLHWLELELIGEDGKPVPSVAYRVLLPSGEIARGFLDSNGYARLEGIPAQGECKISFPGLDGDAWEFLHDAPSREGR